MNGATINCITFHFLVLISSHLTAPGGKPLSHGDNTIDPWKSRKDDIKAGLLSFVNDERRSLSDNLHSTFSVHQLKKLVQKQKQAFLSAHLDEQGN